ncbi:MAG: hypothetical protein ACRD1S_09920, partial [Vicinamibacterales bacterium]
FPEGTSHSTGRLEPLRTGAARIALAAAEAGIDAAIVPVGLNFDWKSAFRSRATVVYGPALRATAEESVRALTTRIAEAMRVLMIEADPIVDAAIVERIDRLYGSARPKTRQQDRVERRRLIAVAIERLRAQDPEWYGEIAERVRTYDARLARFGLRDRDLDEPVPFQAAARFALREALLAILLAPLVLAGLAMFVVPYRVTDWVAGRTPLDVQATTKVIAGFVMYGLWIALIGWLAWSAFGADGAAIALALLPPVALASLFAIEREAAVVAAVRGWLAVRRASPGVRARLGRTRNEIAEALEEVRDRLASAETTKQTEITTEERR